MKGLPSTVTIEEGHPNVISLFINHHLTRESKDTKRGNLLLLRGITASDSKLSKAILKHRAAPTAQLSPWTPPCPTASCP